jgi:hypothetical protein
LHQKYVTIAGKEYIYDFKTQKKYKQMFMIIEIIDEELG